MQYSIKLLEDSKYHVKHQKERKEASFFNCQDRCGGLGVKTKKLYHWEKHVKKLKKVVNEKVFKSKKPKKYAKTAVFFTPEGRFLR